MKIPSHIRWVFFCMLYYTYSEQTNTQLKHLFKFIAFNFFSRHTQSAIISYLSFLE